MDVDDEEVSEVSMKGANDKKRSQTRQTKRKHVIETLLKGPEYSVAVYGI